MPAFDPDVLDQPERLAELDRTGMLRALAGAGAQVRRALTTAADAGIGPSKAPSFGGAASRGQGWLIR